MNRTRSIRYVLMTNRTYAERLVKRTVRIVYKGLALMKADDVSTAMGKFLCGEKPSTREEADALTRAMELMLWEARPPRGPHIVRASKKSRFSWLRFVWR